MPLSGGHLRATFVCLTRRYGWSGVMPNIHILSYDAEWDAGRQLHE